MTDDRMLSRIAALLRQAEGTDNIHEAEAFMAAAQRLATMTSIDLAVARAHSASRMGAQTPTQRTITIGEPGSRGLRTYVQLFAAIALANDVRCDVASNSTYVYAYGFGEDIDASHALRRDTPRPRVGPVTEPVGRRGWDRVLSCRVLGPGCRGEHPGQPTFPGLFG